MKAIRLNYHGQDIAEELPTNLSKLESRIMYIENKSGGLNGSGRIGRVYFSRTKKTVYYNNRAFKSLGGSGIKANFVDIESGEEYWISGPKKKQGDRLYGSSEGVEIDDDVKGEYLKMLT